MSIPITIFVFSDYTETSNSILIASTSSRSDSWFFLIALNPIASGKLPLRQHRQHRLRFNRCPPAQPVSMRQHVNLRLGRILADAADGTDSAPRLIGRRTYPDDPISGSALTTKRNINTECPKKRLRATQAAGESARIFGPADAGR